MFKGLALAFVWAAIPCSVRAQGTTMYVYDDNGRLVAVISPSGEAAVYEYDPAGNFTAIRRLAPDALELLTFSPREGGAGDLVTFVGVGFGAGVSAVSFNGVTARIVQANATTVVAEVPVGATTGPVSLTTPRGTVTTPTPFVVVQSVRVSPAVVTIDQGGQQQFTAAVTSFAGDQSVRWSVNGIEGGNFVVGTITTGGLYSAPLSSSVFIIRATSVAMPSLFGEAQVRVQTVDAVQPAFSPGLLVQRMAPSQPQTQPALSAGVLVQRLTTSPPQTQPAVSAGVLVQRTVPAQPQTQPAISDGVLVQRTVQAQPQTQPAISTGVLATKGPNISAISPSSLPVGAAATITISGANLGGVTTINFVKDDGSIDANISASNITITPGGNSLTVTVTVSGSAALGRRTVIVMSPTGHSQIFNVGQNMTEIVAQ